MLDKGPVGVWHCLRSLEGWGPEGAVLGATMKQPEVEDQCKGKVGYWDSGCEQDPRSLAPGQCVTHSKD